MRHNFQVSLIPAALAALGALGCGQAQASGFQLWDQNAAGTGNAHAGSAANAENASTIFYNPAGLTQLSGKNLSVGATAVAATCKFTNGASSSGALTIAGNGGDGCGSAILPNAYFSAAVSKDLSLGVGMGAPFGLATEYQHPWIGSAQSIKFDITSLNINPTIAYRLNETVSLGFGLDWQRFEAEYIRTAGAYNNVLLAPLSAALPAGTPFSTAGVLAHLKVSDASWGWNAGALFKLSPETRLGISYRSGIKHRAEGDLTLTSDGSTGATIAQAVLSSMGGAGDASATIKLPDVWIFSASHALNDEWQLLADVSRTGWSSMQDIDIVMRGSGTVAQTLHLKYRDTWRAALGANYKLSDQTKLRFGIAYDQSPTKDDATRYTGLPDSDRTWLSFGAQWKTDKDSAFDLGVTYVRLKDSKIHNDQTDASNPYLSAGLVDGSYRVRAWVLGLQYSQSF